MEKSFVEEEDTGKSLAIFLKERLVPDLSLRKIKSLIEAGACFVNGRVERFSKRLVGKGMCISLHRGEGVHMRGILGYVLHSDEYFLACDKVSTIHCSVFCQHSYHFGYTNIVSL